MTAILDACDRYPIMGIYNHGNRQRMKTLTLLMRYSGLRIGDAVTCARDRLVGSKLFLYQAKTGTPVYCPLLPIVVDALTAVEGQNSKYFFWTGNGKRKSAVADAQRSFRKLFELAEVDGHPHMFRDTFAVELLKEGVSLETVSMLLGHASIKVTEKHYKPWVKTLQDKLEVDAIKGWPSAPFRKGRRAGSHSGYLPPARRISASRKAAGCSGRRAKVLGAVTATTRVWPSDPS
jgi:integrase